ncbi:class I SAM-dependent methyltransferase [Ktedonobacter racemifer]|uniref:Methyltransferase type 12 n=1 Tax=Ktedonobacter racemifer DSM 44963 TaxID=485913 RepID=D6TY77_KTERA|nr:methyltransferase domain-containing protein [Ktedonobacter racemifer]EFH85073.1 Methyltransferase type 12 [Ktedonobacter racemifer DSM 44963]
MQHQDHVQLIHQGISAPGGTWADLGSGGGAFTLALANLLGSGAHIYSVDQDKRALQEQARAMRARFPAVAVEYIVADFTRLLNLPPLDGILLANSLHFVRHKGAVLDQLRSYLRPGGSLLLIEYNADHGNPWVPYPLSYPTWEKLAQQHGFGSTRLLATVPSRFLREMYAALSIMF